MKTRFFLTNILLATCTWVAFAGTVTPPAELPAYYSGVDGKSASNLFEAVHTVTIKNFSQISYDGLKSAYATTDVYPSGHDNAGKIWDMYSNCAFTFGNTCGSYSVECDCYNREHSIPQSWWGGGTGNQGSDIFHVIPTDGKVNGMRSNYPFGEVSSAEKTSGNGSKLGTASSISITNTVYGDYTGTCSDKVFEPVDEYKGDFARSYFGTLLHWTNKSFTSGEGSSTFSGTNTQSGGYGLTKYGVALLLKWHRQDPVSQKEIDRNNGIQKTQGNRNPFIDYPDLAEYIWGSHAGEAFSLATATATFSDDYDPTTGGGGGTVDPPVFEPFDFIIYCNGATQVITSTTETYTLKTVADACSDWAFTGWSATKVEKTTAKPEFITTVSGPTTVYAVYKNTVTSGGGSNTTTLVMENIAAASFVSDGITFEANKASGANEPTYNATGKDARFYAGNTLTISCENEMSQIVFNISTQGLKRLAPITASTGEIATQTLGDQTVTWTGNATSVTFTVGAKSDYGTDDNKAGQLDFTSVDITTGGGSTTITYASDAECVAPCEGQLATPNVTATAGDKQIFLNWEEVNGAEDYEVTLVEGEGFTTECNDPIIGEIILTGTTNTCVISGLINGLSYTTYVKALGTTICNSEADEDITAPSEDATGPATSIETTDETHVQIFVNEGTIRSNGIVRIYDITGKEVTRINGTLSRGIYIIRTSEGAQKVLVP